MKCNQTKLKMNTAPTIEHQKRDCLLITNSSSTKAALHSWCRVLKYICWYRFLGIASVKPCMAVCRPVARACWAPSRIGVHQSLVTWWIGTMTQNCWVDLFKHLSQQHPDCACVSLWHALGDAKGCKCTAWLGNAPSLCCLPGHTGACLLCTQEVVFLDAFLVLQPP